MSKLIVLRGLPGCGKSTKAAALLEEYGNFVRVNKDLLRKMLHFNKFNSTNERITINGEIELAKALLLSNTSVIVDDTNLREKDKSRWIEVAKTTNSSIQFIDMTDVDINTCIENDLKRLGTDSFVGKNVIVDMAMRNGLLEEVQTVLCDIDGTVADCTHRLHHIQKEQKDWKSFFAQCHEDEPIISTIEQVRQFSQDGYRIIMVSARNEECRPATEEWLIKNGVPFFHLIMRKANDHRDDAIVKKDILDGYFKDKNKIYKVIDDRPRVIRMWKENGLDVIDVGKGIEF